MMRYVLIFVVIIAWMTNAAVEGGADAGGGGGAGAPPKPPPEVEKYKASKSCANSLGKCFKQLSAKLKEGEPFAVPQTDPPCKACNATQVYTLFLSKTCARICPDMPENESDKAKELMYYHFVICFESMFIDCKDCVAKSPTGDQIGDTTMDWTNPCVEVFIKKEPWSGTAALVLSSTLKTDKETTLKQVKHKCTGTDEWIKACDNMHKTGGFMTILTAAAQGMFPQASNKMIDDTKGDGDNSIGTLLGCNSEQISSSEEDCSG